MPIHFPSGLSRGARLLLAFPGVLAVVLLATGFAIALNNVALELGRNLGVLGGKVVFLSPVLAQVVRYI